MCVVQFEIKNKNPKWWKASSFLETPFGTHNDEGITTITNK
jgi:hypothetical protein